MLIVLVPLFYFLLSLVVFNRKRNAGLRHLFIETTLLSFAFVAITTEILSLFRLLNGISLILLWLGADLILFGLIRRKIRSMSGEIWKDLREKIKSVPRFYLILLIFIKPQI